MNCAEFQKALPYIIDTGGNAEEQEHLRGCPICSDLVQDLRYIAEQAKLLVPMEDPSPKVWEGIRGSLEREGMIKPARARGRLLGPIPWIGTLAALILVIFALFLAERGKQEAAARATAAPAPAARPQVVSVAAAPTAQDDERLLQEVATRRPSSASTYQSNLKQVNAAISDAQQTLEQSPDDDVARDSLMQAYQQKALIYEMATRSLQ